MKFRRWIVGVVPLLLPVALATNVDAEVITVSGKANIYGAGYDIPNDTPGGGEAAPYFDLGGTGSGRVITFASVTGSVKFQKNSPTGHPPDGSPL